MKTLNTPPRMNTLNLCPPRGKCLLKKNQSLNKQLLHKKQWRDHIQKEEIDMVTMGTLPPTPQSTVGNDVTEGPACRRAHTGTQRKDSVLESNYTISEENLVTNPRVSAKQVENCWNSLQDGRFWRTLFYIAPTTTVQ